ncbi:MAG: glycosyltransferase family 4 protein, partial [Thermogutta sp.]
MLPFGIHRRFFTAAHRPPRSASGPLRVLFAANSPVRKGLPDLVIAIEKLSSGSIRPIFAGEITSLAPYAVQRASRVGVLLGNVPRARMTDLYRDADVFVLPTVSDTFGAVVLEAMAAGLPVIITPNCGSADVVRDGIDGFIVPVRAPDAIAEKLELLAANPDLRWTMGRAAADQAS